MTDDARQVVRFLFLSLDPAWRRIGAEEQAAHKAEFGETVQGFRARLLLRTYGLSGTRGDADLLLWQVADSLETLQALQTAVFSTRLGGYLRIAHSYLGMTRRSIYEFPPPPDPERGPQVTVRPQDSGYLFVYPFVKTREWYALAQERRQGMMEEHVRIGRKHPGIRLNTIYSFGLDDQEFVLAFESDDPADFLDLVMELRESAASAYTLRDTPILTCIQMSLWDALDSLGGAATIRPAAGDAFTEVARLRDLEGGRGKRAYLGADAIALFQVDGRVFAVSDRCTHGRASLSEGSVDPVGCRLTCPWHGGVFELGSGLPAGGPVRVPLRTYEVRVEGDRVLVR